MLIIGAIVVILIACVIVYFENEMLIFFLMLLCAGGFLLYGYLRFTGNKDRNTRIFALAAAVSAGTAVFGIFDVPDFKEAAENGLCLFMGLVCALYGLYHIVLKAAGQIPVQGLYHGTEPNLLEEDHPKPKFSYQLDGTDFSGVPSDTVKTEAYDFMEGNAYTLYARRLNPGEFTMLPQKLEFRDFDILGCGILILCIMALI